MFKETPGFRVFLPTKGDPMFGTRLIQIFSALPFLFLVVHISRSDDSKPEGPGDVIPSGTVTDLRTLAVTDSSATLTWTATGDDDTTGTAAIYDLRYSTRPDSLPHWWDSLGIAVDSLPPPRVSGEVETALVQILQKDSTYYVVLKVADEVPN